MVEQRFTRLLCFLFALCFYPPERLEAELRNKIPDRVSKSLYSPRSGLFDRHDHDEDHDPMGGRRDHLCSRGEGFDLHFIGKPIMNVFFWEKCSHHSVEAVADDDMYILTSRHQPNPYFCSQNFRVENSTSVLHLHCYSLALRFSCRFESLKFHVDNGVHKVCSSSIPPLQYAGRFIGITYERTLFGLHGGYTCALVARASDLPEIVEPLCGISENDPDDASVTLRVVEGEDVKKSAFPWMVLLRVKAKTFSFVCGGTLVSEAIVVTAAHCLSDEVQEILIGLGKILLQDDNEKGSVWMTSKNFTLHPNFDGRRIVNDIGVIFLPTRVTFTDNIRPACLPSVTMSENSLVGYTATALGWGSTQHGDAMPNNLQKVNLVIWTNEDCETAWSDFKVSIQDTEMCAFSEGKDTCNGDSGGPLLVKFEGRWILTGITSYGFECASPGIPGVYTRVTKFVPWIRHYMSNDMSHYNATE